jgi:hypothetical protein
LFDLSMKLFDNSVLLLVVMNMFNRIFNTYQSWATKSPYITNCSMGFIIAGVGDVLCQRYFEYPAKRKEEMKLIEAPRTNTNGSSYTSGRQLVVQNFEWDKKRSLQMGFIRAAVITPFVLFWYPFLVYLSPGPSLLRVMSRVMIDQSIGSPIVVTLVFLANAILNNDLPNFLQQLKERFFITWVTGLKYWPFVHMFTFGIIPAAYQPLFAHFASVYWNAVLSYYSNMKTNNTQQNDENSTSIKKVV